MNVILIDEDEDVLMWILRETTINFCYIKHIVSKQHVKRVYAQAIPCLRVRVFVERNLFV